MVVDEELKSVSSVVRRPVLDSSSASNSTEDGGVCRRRPPKPIIPIAVIGLCCFSEITTLPPILLLDSNSAAIKAVEDAAVATFVTSGDWCFAAAALAMVLVGSKQITSHRAGFGV